MSLVVRNDMRPSRVRGTHSDRIESQRYDLSAGFNICLYAGLFVRPVGSRIRLIVAVGLVGLVMAAILVTQRFPLSPFSSVAISGIRANCATMIEDSSNRPVTARSGTILFGCSARTGWPPTSLDCGEGCPSAYPVFNVSQTGDYTPVFTLPQYYTGLFVAGTTGCSPPAGSGSPPAQLTNGAKMQLSGSGSSPNLFYYCASYASVASTGATLSSFTISWGLGSTVFGQTIPSVAVPPEPPPTALSVVRGIDNGLYYATLAGGWSGWQSLGGSTAGQAVFCSGGSGRLYLSVRGLDNRTIYLKSYSNGAWSAWTSPDGLTTAEPACASMNGTLHLLVRGVEYGLWYNSLDEVSGRWSGWQSLGGSVSSSPVLAASPGLNRLDVVVEGEAGSIWHKAFINGVWSPAWDSPMGITSDVPAVSSDGQTLHIVVRGAGNDLWYNSLNFTTSFWSGWIPLKGTTGITPSLATDSSGTVHLFVVGVEGQIYDKSLAQGGVWSTSWDSAGGTTNNPVAVTTQGSNIAIMVSATNGGIWYNTLAGSVWQGWTGLGGSTALAPALSAIS